MTMSASEVGQICSTLQRDARSEWLRLTTLQKKIEGRLVSTWTPDNADLEYRDLLRKASSPWLMFGRDVIAQGCIVDGYTDDEVWREVWQKNGMDGRQADVNREAVGLGKSFLMLLPSDDGGVFMRPVSSLNTFAVYSAPWDEYPKHALIRVGKKAASFWSSEWYFIDGEDGYRFNGDPARPENMTVVEHKLGFCPVVMIPNTLAIDGQPKSSVEPAVSVYQRIVDATFTLQMVQRYGAFPQKWMAGGTIGKTEDGKPAVRASVDSLLHAEGVNGETARFGTFEAADLNQVVAALEAHIKHLAVILQVPGHYFLGVNGNMSPDGIAAEESGYHRNIAERQTAMGEGYELAMRTGAAILGLDAAAADTSSQVHWDDVATYSLNQVADAVSKLFVVGAPLEMLFALVPGWSKTDVITAADEVRRLQQQRALEAPPAA
jgi:hypothetical protein